MVVPSLTTSINFPYYFPHDDQDIQNKSPTVHRDLSRQLLPHIPLGSKNVEMIGSLYPYSAPRDPKPTSYCPYESKRALSGDISCR